MENILLEFALFYAQLGWPVFPLHSPFKNGCSCGNSDCTNAGKHPRTVHGFKDATTDEKQIRAWWDNWPDANIGIRTGAKSGLVVLDVDPRHKGYISLYLSEKAHGGLPPCPTVHTGGGGRHKYLSHPGIPIKNKTGIGPGLDIRGDGGYVVAPPSRHSSGKRYEWSEHIHLDQSSIPLLPEWLQKMAGEGKPKETSISAGTIQEGERNTALTSLAGAMRRRGATQEAILAALQQENQRRCEPPLSDTEVEGIAVSVSKYAPDGQRTGGSSLLDLLADLLGADVTFLHTPDKEAYATIKVDDHHENWRLRDASFKRWLAARFYERFQVMPRSQVLNDILAVMEGIAFYDSPEEEVYTRLAEHKGTIYLDLCNASWQVVEITAHRWRVIANPPVKFRRARGMKPLPVPETGGSVKELRAFLNLSCDDDFVVIVAWLLAALSPRGPYPVLVLQGEAGSAKSTTVRAVRELVDPNTSPLRSEPRETRDLMIAASNAWCIAFDNVSHLSWRLSDDLCRLATGGGFSTRRLYTDNEEELFDARRPLILNGIEGVVSRGDLLDRAIVIYLPVIPDKKRQSEKQVWKSFYAVQPRILGALLHAVSHALRRAETVEAPRLPRMADFAQWIIAAEPVLGWAEGTFLNAYESNRASANTLGLEASLITRPLRRLCAGREPWSGTAAELLQDLAKHAVEEQQQRSWPKSAWALSIQLRRIAPNLRATGLDVHFGEKTAGAGSRRIITITRIEREGQKQIYAQGVKGPDGIWRFPFPRAPKNQTASQSSESDA